MILQKHISPWRHIISFSLLAVVAVLIGLSGCSTQTADLNPPQPIFISLPDSSTSYYAPGKSVRVEIAFTTDRPISYVKGMYEIDSSHLANHVYTYPDTLFNIPLDTSAAHYVNVYNYADSFHIPTTVHSRDIIRFRISTEAKFRLGSGMDMTPIYYSKEFKITVK